jgi:heme-degrading monooxygenase HmoA
MSLAIEEELVRSADPSARPVITISVISPKAENFDELLELQLAQQRRARGQVKGLLGGRLFRSTDDRSLVIVAAFETAEDAQRWREDRRLIEHIERVRPLIERAAAGIYETLYEVGAI